MGGCDLPRAIVNWVKGEPVPDSMLTARTGFKAYKELGITKV
jgi:carbamoyl-phosphate synthase large subunit